eukprot:m.100034 g.100034  ORF g.100034 m.100034 type:complete len:569 (-) comp13156_c0_seq3:233-1939(-)
MLRREPQASAGSIEAGDLGSYLEDEHFEDTFELNGGDSEDDGDADAPLLGSELDCNADASTGGAKPDTEAGKLFGVPLLRPKMIYTLFWGGMGSLYPFLPVFYKQQQNLTFKQIGVIGLVFPLVKFFTSPLITNIADRFHRHFTVLVVFTVISLVLRTTMLGVSGFAATLTLIVLAEAMGSASGPIIEAGVFSVLPDRQLYGKQRLFGAVGYGITSFTSGLIASKTSSFVVMFVQQIVLQLIGVWICHAMVKDKPDQSSTCSPFDSQQTKASTVVVIDEIGSSKVDSGSEGAATTHTCNSVNTDSGDITSHAVTDLLEGQSEASASSHSFDDSVGDDSNIGGDTGDESAENDVKPIGKPTMLSALRVVASNRDATIFFTVVLIAGFGTGIIDSFLFLFIEELGGDHTTQGVARLVMCASELPLFWFSGKIISALGLEMCLMLTFACYILRFILYSIMHNPWLVVLSEPLHGITFAVMWATSTKYASELAPEGLAATMQGKHMLSHSSCVGCTTVKYYAVLLFSSVTKSANTSCYVFDFFIFIFFRQLLLVSLYAVIFKFMTRHLNQTY